ncbi:CDP-diacylglycerol--glycerol-3-phosphate 3-phosphatidyltransferase [Chitinispirillum alkaliphilum]|nr:CDP-diacylglycerol--glycerol-3-phosphate 3-phosphatidyltransferase [Chitinispirillum alkaliphilum]
MGVVLFIIAAGLSIAARWREALGFLILGALMDGLDGLLARESGKTSDFGAILDSSCDRITEIALLMGLLVYYINSTDFGNYSAYLCFTALAGSVMVSYVKARCEGAGISCSRGILQRPERLILIALGFLLGPDAMVWILALTTLLSVVTVVERLVVAFIACRQTSEKHIQLADSPAQN